MDKNYWIVTDYPHIKTSEYLDEYREIFGEDSVGSYYSNEQLDNLCPPPKEREIVKFLSNIEPDTEHLGKSYNDFSQEKDKTFADMRKCILLALSVRKIMGEIIDFNGFTISSTLYYSVHVMSVNIDANSKLFVMSMNRNVNGKFFISCDNRGYHSSVSGPRQQF